ncbi:hypothetical protein OSB04_011301 [Centaurea solstitialis]|uniref:Pentatricopeptide repeat-containing protein n=1 Tax=Centaurea solstitialis TaxID=347529 RepID=A0AA38WCT2_9ASTR|nr:hypothetical protein OSB04_011301 [Centaurea solstitialis]
MAEVGCVPDRVTYNILLWGLLKNKHHDTIKMLLEEMDGKGCFVERMYQCLLALDSIFWVDNSNIITVKVEKSPNLYNKNIVDVTFTVRFKCENFGCEREDEFQPHISGYGGRDHKGLTRFMGGWTLLKEGTRLGGRFQNSPRYIPTWNGEYESFIKGNLSTEIEKVRSFTRSVVESIFLVWLHHSQLQMKMKMNILIKGTFIAPSFKNPFLFSAIQMISAPHLSMCQKITKLDDALQLFDQMSQRKPLPSVVKFNQLLQAVTKMQHYSCSIHLFKQMVAIGAPVNLYTFNIVIKCCCQMSCTRDGFAVVAYGFRRGFVPDVYIFSTLLNGLVLEDRILEAERLFKKLIKGKLCEPDVVMYSTMIKGLCKVGINDTAIGLLRLMDERGCKPDVMTYSTIIDSLCKDKMVDDALKLFNEMIFHKGIVPDVVTYSSLIRGLCNLSRWDDAVKMLREMEDERISPNVITYNILVDAFCKEGMVEDAEAVLNIMVERGKVPDLVTYNSLIDGFCLRGETKKAKEIFDLIRMRGLVHNVVTYNSLLNGYCKKSKIDEALHLFHEITEQRMKPDVITYNTMLQGLFRVGRYKDALELFNEMKAHIQIPPGAFTYGIVLEGLCNNHQVDEALSLFRLMSEKKLSFDIVMYNILIDGASKCGKLDIAKVLFNDLCARGLYPDVWTYNAMICGFCWEGLVRESKELFQKMAEVGCVPDRVTYNILLRGLLKNGQHDTIKMLLEEMDGKGFSIDASTCSMLIDRISIKSLDDSLLKLIGKLVPKEVKEAACLESI